MRLIVLILLIFFSEGLLAQNKTTQDYIKKIKKCL